MPKHIWVKKYGWCLNTFGSKNMGDAWTHLGRKCVLGIITHNFFGKLGIWLMAGYVISVRKNLSFYLSLYFERSPSAEVPKGVMWWGRSLYDSMFPWKDFLMGQIRKIQKHKEERKRRNFYICGGSHTCVFSIGQECPQATVLVWPSLRRTHSYGNLPYSITQPKFCKVLLPKIQERNIKKCQRNFPICKVWLTGQWDLTALV